MSDTTKEVPVAGDQPVVRPRKPAAQQVQEQAANPSGNHTVHQTITQTVEIPVKDGQTVSDAVKDWMVSNGGFEGEGIVPGPSGAIVERQVRESQSEQMSHPAIDDNPRRGLPLSALQRDMNDPRFDRVDAAQGLAAGTTAEPST